MTLDILDRITVLLDGKDQKELTEYLGLKNVAFSEWKSGKSKSYRKYLIEIANFFDVSLDYLVYGRADSNQLPVEDAKMLSIFNHLKPADKIRVMERAETLAELAAERAAKEREAEQPKRAARIAAPADGRLEPEDDEPEQTEEFYIDLCSLPASAGSGVQLDEGFTEPMQIKPTPIAKRANYAVKVSGNSMEDTYYDGDIVLVETCPDVAIGEIGIFTVNDQGYIKQRGKDKLISLNPKCDDVPIHKGDVVYCRGRVLGKAEIIE